MPHLKTDAPAWMSHCIEQVNDYLDQYIRPSSCPVSQAIRYSLLNGGKRLRALMVYAAGHCIGLDTQQTTPTAAAIECMHSYSLIHDDLPSMDDDPIRRGQPSCHCVFGEATAILAGDALQAMAFELCSNIGMVHCLARAAGLQGMIRGQQLDLGCESANHTPETLMTLMELKTARLFSCALQLPLVGATNSGVQDLLNPLAELGLCWGLAYQIQDDINDAQTDQTRAPNKPTALSCFGYDSCQQMVDQYYEQAGHLLSSLPQHDCLAQLNQLLRATG